MPTQRTLGNYLECNIGNLYARTSNTMIRLPSQERLRAVGGCFQHPF